MHDVTITTYTTLSASEVSAEEHVNTLQHWDDETQLGGSQWREKKKPKSPGRSTTDFEDYLVFQHGRGFRLLFIDSISLLVTNSI